MRQHDQFASTDSWCKPCQKSSNVTQWTLCSGVTFPHSGIGLALCERLLTHDSQIQLCLACRNMERAGAAQQALLTSHPDSEVTLLKLDVGSIRSVLRAAQEVKLRWDGVWHQKNSCMAQDSYVTEISPEISLIRGMSKLRLECSSVMKLLSDTHCDFKETYQSFHLLKGYVIRHNL